MEPLTSEEATKRWKKLLEIERSLRPSSNSACTRNGASSSSTARPSVWNTRKRKRSAWKEFSDSQRGVEEGSSIEKDNKDQDDPFDCQSVAVLPTYDLVENTIQEYLIRWKQLDDRKVRQTKLASALASRPPTVAAATVEVGPESANNDKDSSGERSPAVPHSQSQVTIKSGWRLKEDRLQLPSQFDYATTRSEPPADDGHSGVRVISLEDPAKTFSYHSELWKLFASVPTSRELEERGHKGHKMDKTFQVYEETQEKKRSTADCHALARLRMADRHGLPPDSVFDPLVGSKERSRCHNETMTTILFECWRRQPKRSSTPDSNRMILEFLESQTLWDVHMTLANMLEDALWEAGACDNDETSGSNGTETNSTNEKNNPSGCFFIEDTFYSTGSVDYVKPILDWIDGYCGQPNPTRRRYLGILHTGTLKHEKSMKHIKLSQVPFRIGIRYYHSCHGDVETSVMLADRKVIQNPKDNRTKLAYPLVHDIWTLPKASSLPLCEACQLNSTIYVTSSECAITDGGPRMICDACRKELRVFEKDPKSVKLYTTWRNEVELSTGIARKFSNIF